MKEYRQTGNLAEIYLEQGFIKIPEFLLPVSDSLPDFSGLEYAAPYKVFEKNGKIRSLYGIHQTVEYRDWEKFLQTTEDLIREILNDEIYIHQSKVNYKENLPDAVWPWHRDFPYWRDYDWIPENHLVNLLLFLDDVTEENGALEVIPGSHHVFFEQESSTKKSFKDLNGSVSSDLDFEIPEQWLSDLLMSNGKSSLSGQTGDIFLFDPDLLHQSAQGNGDNQRRLMIITYNACSNAPLNISGRPSYLASRDYSPLKSP